MIEQIPPPEPQEEPILDWHLSRWQGSTADGLLFVWMEDKTLQRYIAGWLETNRIVQPTNPQRYAALTHVRKLSYWTGCVDPEVHIIGYQHALAERRRAYA